MVIDIKKKLGQRIKYYRKARGLSQESLAEMLDISPRSLGNAENGRYFLSLTNLQKLFEVLNINPYELFIFDKEAPKDIVYNDVLKKLENFKGDKKKLYAISAFLDALN